MCYISLWKWNTSFVIYLRMLNRTFVFCDRNPCGIWRQSHLFLYKLSNMYLYTSSPLFYKGALWYTEVLKAQRHVKRSVLSSKKSHINTCRDYSYMVKQYNLEILSVLMYMYRVYRVAYLVNIQLKMCFSL